MGIKARDEEGCYGIERRASAFGTVAELRHHLAPYLGRGGLRFYLMPLMPS
jgi:hypothetical protein